MKKALIIAIVFLVNLGTSISASALSAQFDWGGSWLTLCEGSGICKSCFPSAESNAEINYDQTTNSIQFAVPENTIPTDKINLFTGSEFKMDYDYTLPASLCDALGIPAGSTLLKGSYALSYDRGVYYFSIKM